jgi:hypothetical protein
LRNGVFVKIYFEFFQKKNPFDKNIKEKHHYYMFKLSWSTPGKMNLTPWKPL